MYIRLEDIGKIFINFSFNPNQHFKACNAYRAISLCKLSQMTPIQYGSAEPPRWHQSPSNSKSLSSLWAAEGEGFTVYAVKLCTKNCFKDHLFVVDF